MIGRRARLTPGTHAVISGGSSGLGEDVASELLSRGLRVTLVARRELELHKAAARLEARHPCAVIDVAPADVTDREQVERIFASFRAAGRPVDLLVNSAGILREGYFDQLQPTDFTDVMAVNFHGTVDMVRAALPSLRERGGRVVNIASVAGLMGVFGYTPYSAAKHALVGFTDSLRFELEPQGIGVHLVCPGEFDSPMVEALQASRTPENRAHTLTIPSSTSESVARDLVRQLERGKRRIIPGRQARLAVLGQRVAPAVAENVARRRIAAAQR